MELIASARCRIDLMIFGWGDDPAGRPVAAALIERARAGVLVRVMIDRGGFVIGETNAHVDQGGAPSFLDALRAEPNVHLIETPDPGFRFDHRKLAVIDDRIAWSGSMILTQPSLERWHNFNYLAEGPIVAQLEAVFAERWESLGGCRAVACTPPDVAADDRPPTPWSAWCAPTSTRRSARSRRPSTAPSTRRGTTSTSRTPISTTASSSKKLVAARARGRGRPRRAHHARRRPHHEQVLGHDGQRPAPRAGPACSCIPR